MTDTEFSELVDLYLDGEISSEQLHTLKAELARDPQRQKHFAERWRLHQAMRAVLAPGSESNFETSDAPVIRGKRRRSRRQSARHTSKSGRRSGRREVGTTTPRVVLPGWIAMGGLAASLCLSFVLLRPVFLDTVDASALPELVGVRQSDLGLGAGEVMELRRSDLERYRKQQELQSLQHASLVAQMRLLGLRPEHTPADKQLQSIHPSATVPKGERISQTEFLARLQTLRPMPEVEIINHEVLKSAAEAEWSRAGFQARLVGF